MRTQSAEKGDELRHVGVADVIRRHAAGHAMEHGVSNLLVGQAQQAERDVGSQFPAMASEPWHPEQWFSNVSRPTVSRAQSTTPAVGRSQLPAMHWKAFSSSTGITCGTVEEDLDLKGLYFYGLALIASST